MQALASGPQPRGFSPKQADGVRPPGRVHGRPVPTLPLPALGHTPSGSAGALGPTATASQRAPRPPRPRPPWNSMKNVLGAAGASAPAFFLT